MCLRVICELFYYFAEAEQAVFYCLGFCEQLGFWQDVEEGCQVVGQDWG